MDKRTAALVADIERASNRDGPGMRTVVFFKGCPLSCRWCHNPECISFEKEELFYPEKCIGCKKCAEGCFSGARVLCGKEMSAEEIVREIERDRVYYGRDGGVTFSGGEPLAQAEVLSRCINLCAEKGISSAVETSMIYYDEAIFRKLSLVMADLKIWDPAIHKRYVYELLPYHPLGHGTARALGREEPLYTIPDKTYMEELSRYAFLR